MTQSLRVGFDITPILYNRGVSRYSSNIIRALADEKVELSLFGSSFRQNKALKGIAKQLTTDLELTTHPSILSFPPSLLSKMWYGVGRLHIEGLMPKVDVFHAWEELIPPSYSTPIVATIHDLAPLKFPQMTHPSTREKHMQAYKRLKEYNSHVIAVSEQTKKDCIELLQFDPTHVHVIHEALPLESKVAKKLLLKREDLAQWKITKPYLLWVGTQEQRKNLQRVIEAWRPFAKDLDLVLVGAQGSKEVVPEPGIKIVGYVHHTALASLYTHAQALIFPSLYEGFGLPILEAFANECPVITSNNSGMSETAGDAAILVDPFNVESISHGIATAQGNYRTAKHLELMKKQLASFSWKESAKATLAVYEQAAKDGFHPLP